MPKRKLATIPPEIIRFARQCLNKKQTDFADLLGISQGKLSKLENGQLRADAVFEERLRDLMMFHENKVAAHLSNQLQPLVKWMGDIELIAKSL